MAFKRRPAHANQAKIQMLAQAKQDELCLHLTVDCLKDDTRCVLGATDSKHSGRRQYAWNRAK